MVVKNSTTTNFTIGDVVVKNASTSNWSVGGRAMGVVLSSSSDTAANILNNLGTGADGKSLKVGNIFVTTGGSGNGFRAGTLAEGYSVSLGNITVTGGVETSHGMELSVAEGAILKTGTIRVTSKGGANGISFADGTVIDKNSSIGEIFVTGGKNAEANNTDWINGIKVQDSSRSTAANLLITNNITVVNEWEGSNINTWANGVVFFGAQDDTVTLKDNVVIKVDGGKKSYSNAVRFQGNTDKTGTIVFDGKKFTNGGEMFNILSGSSLTLDAQADIQVEGALTVAKKATITGNAHFSGGLIGKENKDASVADTATEALTIESQTVKDKDGNATAYKGSRVEFGGAVLVDSTTIGGADLTVNGKTVEDAAVLAVNATEPTDLGTLTFNGANSKLEIWGEDATKHEIASYTGTNEEFKKHVVNYSKFFEVELDGGKIKFAGQREYASMGDGYMAALAMHGRYTAWNAVRDRMISGNRSGRFLGQAPCDPCAPCGVSECDPCEPVCESDCNPCDPCGHGFGRGGLLAGNSLGRSAWVNYVGRADSYQSSHLRANQWRIGSDGVQVGADLYKTSRSQFGVLFGYEGGWATADLGNGNVDRVDSDDTYVGFYAARVLSNGADVRAIVNYGSQNYDTVRFDPQIGGLADRYFASFDGETVEVNLELGKRLHRGAWSVRPMVGFDLLYNDLDGATETDYGTNLNAVRYNGVDYTQAFVKFGSDLKFQRNRFTFDSGLYYSYDFNGERPVGAISADDGTTLVKSQLRSSKLGRSVLTFNVGGEYQFRCLSVFGGFQGQGVLDRDGDGFQSVGYVGGAWKW